MPQTGICSHVCLPLFHFAQPGSITVNWNNQLSTKSWTIRIWSELQQNEPIHLEVTRIFALNFLCRFVIGNGQCIEPLRCRRKCFCLFVFLFKRCETCASKQWNSKWPISALVLKQVYSKWRQEAALWLFWKIIIVCLFYLLKGKKTIDKHPLFLATFYHTDVSLMTMLLRTWYMYCC